MRMNTITHPPLAVNIKDESFVKDLGIRVAEARKERISALPTRVRHQKPSSSDFLAPAPM
jgi:hypothetical protein